MQRRQPRRYRPELDRLDHRLLPSGGVTASLSRGVLVIRGTAQGDAIDVIVRATSPRRGAAIGQVQVAVEGQRRLRFARVRSIEVFGGDGSDVIRIPGLGRVGLPTRIEGGAGNDTIIGGAGNDTILGGDGDDQLWGRAGRNLIDSGAGRDEVDGVLEAPVPILGVPSPIPTPVPIPIPTPAPNPLPNPTPPRTVEDLIYLVNLERTRVGLAPLAADAKLMRAAQLHADNMARLDRMEHTLAGVAQPDLVSRAQFVGYRYSWLGENIAYNFPDAGSVHYAWMNSSGHRANILGANFTQIGVAIARNSLGQWYYCQIFGRPA